MTDANTRRRLASLAWIVHDLIELIGSNRAPDTKKDLEELIGRLVDDETGQVTEQVTGQVKTPGEQKVEALKFETMAELEKRCALQIETIRELRSERDELKANLAHAIEVKNRAGASVNRLYSQVVELQAQLKGGSK